MTDSLMEQTGIPGLFRETGRLTPQAPYDLQKSLDFLGDFPPTRYEQIVKPGSLTKAICLDRQVVGFELKNSGTVDAPALDYTLFSAGPLSEKIKSRALEKAAFFLSLTDDMGPFYAIAKKDPYFAHIIPELYGYHQVKFISPFENACWAVIHQRNHITVSRRMKQDLTKYFDRKVNWDGQSLWAFPEPAQVAGAGFTILNEVIRNERKTECVLSAAEVFSTVDQEFLYKASYDEVKKWLLTIRGVGEWSSTFILLRGLGRMEHLPIGDKGLLEAVKAVYGPDMEEADLLRIAKDYGNWQGYWAHYLRVAV
jgi:DNA-3-methyladenine glycosylase II